MALFSVDWEDWNHALHISGEKRIKEPTLFLMDILKKYKVKAIFYMLKRAYDENVGFFYNESGLYDSFKEGSHVQGFHGNCHDRNEKPGDDAFWNGMPFRSPYWDTTPMPWPPSGGFFFRVMPYAYVKWAVEKSGVFWIHPHDLDQDHPQLKNPLLNWKRHVGLKTARKKLDRLLREVEWDEPS